MCIVKFCDFVRQKMLKKKLFYTLISHADEDSFCDLYVVAWRDANCWSFKYNKVKHFYDSLIAHRILFELIKSISES